MSVIPMVGRPVIQHPSGSSRAVPRAALILINPEATQHDLVWELHGLLDELERSLCVLSEATYADGSAEAPVLAVIRQTRSIRQLAEIVSSKAHSPKDPGAHSDSKENNIFSYDRCLEMAEELAETQDQAFTLVSTLELSPPETLTG